MRKNGALVTNSVYLMPHEQATVDFLLRQRFKIELIPRSRIPGVHTADILLNETPYEIKSPLGDKKWTIARNLKRARRQSRNIVLDLRRIKRNENLCIREIQNYLNNSHIIEEILIITKERSLIDMRKKG